MTETVRHINEAIDMALSEQGADLKAYEIAEAIAVRGEDEITFPALVLPDGECISVYGETDNHDVTLYHRLNEIAFQEDARSSFGRSTGYVATADMSLVVFGKREFISPWEMERIARSAIAACDGCSLVRSDFSSLQIFASEYAGVTYFLSPEYFLFKINYRITCAYNPRCKK